MKRREPQTGLRLTVAAGPATSSDLLAYYCCDPFGKQCTQKIRPFSKDQLHDPNGNYTCYGSKK